MEIQPQYKANLLNLVETFKEDSFEFTGDYNDK